MLLRHGINRSSDGVLGVFRGVFAFGVFEGVLELVLSRELERSGEVFRSDVDDFLCHLGTGPFLNGASRHRRSSNSDL